MTKADYIKEYGRSYLATRLMENNWPDDAEIIIGGGLLAPNNKTSNLYFALCQSKTKEYCVGGHRQRGTEGWWFAVKL